MQSTATFSLYKPPALSHQKSTKPGQTDAAKARTEPRSTLPAAHSSHRRLRGQEGPNDRRCPSRSPRARLSTAAPPRTPPSLQQRLLRAFPLTLKHARPQGAPPPPAPPPGRRDETRTLPQGGRAGAEAEHSSGTGSPRSGRCGPGRGSAARPCRGWRRARPGAAAAPTRAAAMRKRKRKELRPPPGHPAESPAPGQPGQSRPLGGGINRSAFD